MTSWYLPASEREAGAGDDAVRLQALHPLVDGRAGNAAFAGDLEERHPRVLHEGGEDLLVDLVEMVLGHMLTVLKSTAQR